jgi:hypothetical protein
MRQLKKYINEKNACVAAAIIVLIYSISSMIAVKDFDAVKIEADIEQKLTLNEKALKKLPFPQVVSSIFTPIIPPPKPPPPPRIVDNTPKVDPYEKYYTELSTYRIFGISREEGGITAYMAKGETTLSLKNGDSFGGKYYIKSITEKEIKVGLSNDSNFEYTISNQ